MDEMIVTAKIIEPADIPIIKKYFEGKGNNIVILTPEIAKELKLQDGDTFEYGFGGDPDYFVDVVSDMNHYFAYLRKERINSEL